METLLHHNSKTYKEAASEASKWAKDKLYKTIHDGEKSVEQTLNRIFTQIPEDVIVPTNKIEFLADAGSKKRIIVGHPKDTHTTERKWQGVHENALSQLCSKAHLPIRYARDLLSQFDQKEDNGDWWGPELLAHNLTELMKNGKGRHLLRSYNGELRGFLSDRYKRLDSQQLAATFVENMNKVGAVPVEGNFSDTTFHLRALLPQVYEPIPNEVLAFGMSWSNSDYGRGANVIEVFALRLWCTNYAIGQNCMRQVHIGKRFEPGNIQFSQKTHDLDTEASVSAMEDVIQGGLKEDNIHRIISSIQEAYEEEVHPKSIFADLRKAIGKGMAEEVIETYNSADIVNLPAGNSKWRMSNALSWVAKEKTVDEQFKLMRLAGQYANMS
ncbi:MAG: hypothetical protein CL793_06540 [Chloroflexi bacterium]|nr:hypothetical protein [Chloroflexota bacterium]